MKERYLQEFLEKIAPFQDLWRSVRFVAYAGEVGGKWVFMGGRVQLSEKEVPSQVLNKVANFDTFFAFVHEFSVESLREVLHGIIESENIHLNLGGGPFFRDIRLCAEGDQNLSWFPPNTFDRARGMDFFKMARPGFSWTIRNDRQIATRPEMASCLKRASERFRRETNIDGTEALARQLTPGLILNSLLCPELQILAPLPFDLDDSRTGGVKITVPATARSRSVSLKAFFYPEPQSPVERGVRSTEYPSEESPFHIEWKPAWPDTATHATVHLFWGEHNIDALGIGRWPASASILGAVDEYFDSEHGNLREALRWNDQRKSEQFELAVVRLLNVLGIPAIWYGKIVDPDRADAAAVIRAGDSTALLLIECTREKPREKFSALSARADQVRRSLHIKAEVLPVVFTAAGVVESDIAQGAEYGIGLIGADELEQLLLLIKTPDVTIDRVLRYLRPRLKITDLILGTSGNWPS